MVESDKMYRFSSNIYTIPLWLNDIYIYVIEISKYSAIASLERSIYRYLYNKDTEYQRVNFEILTAK